MADSDGSESYFPSLCDDGELVDDESFADQPEGIFGFDGPEIDFGDFGASKHASLGSDCGFEHVGELTHVNDKQPWSQGQSSPQMLHLSLDMRGTALLAHAFTMNMDIASSLPLPWETGTMRDIFSDDVLPSFNPTVLDTTDLSQLDVSNLSAASDVLPLGGDEIVKPAYVSAVGSLRDVDYVESKRAQLTLASSRWMEILSIDLRACSVGEQICMDLQAEPSGDLAEQSLRAVFGVKSRSTYLLKRAASLKQDIVWFQKRCVSLDTYVSPFPLQESDVWSYFVHLKQMRLESAKGYTHGLLLG